MASSGTTFTSGRTTLYSTYQTLYSTVLYSTFVFGPPCASWLAAALFRFAVRNLPKLVCVRNRWFFPPTHSITENAWRRKKPPLKRSSENRNISRVQHTGQVGQRQWQTCAYKKLTRWCIPKKRPRFLAGQGLIWGPFFELRRAKTLLLKIFGYV